MTIILPPHCRADDQQDSDLCHEVCSKAFALLIDDLTASGWRRKELAVYLADIADDYVLDLASRTSLSKAQTS